MAGLEQAPEVEDEFQEEQEVEQEEQEQPQSNPEEDKARKSGWTNKDEWKDAGHNEDDWKSARNFNEFGDVLANLKSQKRDFDDSRQQFDSRLENQRKFMEAASNQQLADLKAKQLLNVENADVEAFNATQKQMDDLAVVNTPPPQAINNDQSVINQWNTTNAWINGSTPKAAFARSEFSRLNNSGMSVSEAIGEMERSVKTEFPTVNERRNMAPRGETPRRSNVPNKPKMLSMSELTSDEKKMRSYWAPGPEGEKQFLQAAKDART